MFRLAAFAPALLVIAAPASAEEIAPAAPTAPAPQVDYSGFETLTTEVAELRSERLLEQQEFFARAAAKGSLLLDTRSAAAFAEGHIKGAVNLPFSDFTEDKLRQVIGEDPNRPIYIYCNNNFSDNIPPVPLKKAPLALNIPTFINLVGYGYVNVWELGDTLPISEVNWVSSEPE